jgi:23S rRNA (cytidine1920-2'-O)/16S rRNA (cytidine1409-2'-O)-methyltransferase
VKTRRLDRVMMARGLAEDLRQAEGLILAGEVFVDGRMVDKPGTPVPEGAEVTRKPRPRFVSRGGEKLDAALARFPVTVADRVAADVGASTGGFTDCLLQRGAARVYAIDVGYGQLAWRLRQDPRVVVMERVNARYLDALPRPVHLIVSDVAFISLRLIYATAVAWLVPGGDVVSLVKPQFEAPREAVEDGGVVRDPAVHRRVLEDVTDALAALGLGLRGLMASPLRGPAGNVEFLGWWTLGAASDDRARWIDRAMAEV